MLRTALIAVAAAVLLAGAAYAFVPEVREWTRELRIERTDSGAETLYFTTDPDAGVDPETYSGEIWIGYTVPRLPTEYQDTGGSLRDENGTACTWANGEGNWVFLMIARSTGDDDITIQTEGAISTEDIDVHGWPGRLIVHPGNHVQAACGDTERGVYIAIMTQGFGRDDTLDLLKQVQYVGE